MTHRSTRLMVLAALCVGVGCSVQTESTPVSSTEALTIPPDLFQTVATTSRNDYLKSRLQAHQTSGIIPALGAALVVDGDTVAAAVNGVRLQGASAQAQIGDAFMLKSCTKPMTGYLAARLIDAGVKLPNGQPLTWNTRIIDVFPELMTAMNPAYFGTTIALLMTHHSGMPYKPNAEQNDEFGNITSSLTGRRYEYVKAAVKDPVVPQQYGGGSIIVAAMFERIFGLPWEQLMSTFVFADLGMTNSGVGENPYPLNAASVASHTLGTGGIPAVWLPPPDYASQPHAPAGRNPHASVLDFARFAAANLPNATHRPGSMSVGGVQGLVANPAGISDATNAGWLSAPSFWDGTPILWHNGSDGHDYSLVYVSPSQNFATTVMANIDIGDAVGNDLTSELLALKAHLAFAGDFDQTKTIGASASASSVYSGAAGYEANKANDGNLRTRWATDSTVHSASLTLTLGSSQSVSQLRVAEEFSRVTSFTLEAWVLGLVGGVFRYHWVTVLTGGQLGANFAGSFPAVNTQSLRLTVNATNGGPTLDEVWVF